MSVVELCHNLPSQNSVFSRVHHSGDRTTLIYVLFSEWFWFSDIWFNIISSKLSTMLNHIVKNKPLIAEVVSRCSGDPVVAFATGISHKAQKLTLNSMVQQQWDCWEGGALCVLSLD